jgi:hypothetical protein
VYVIEKFIESHSSGDLWALFFFVTIGSNVIGWVFDVVIGDRGFGVLGNGFLIALGGITGVVISQMFLPIASMPEIQRVTLFSTATAASILLSLCIVKSWLRVT